MLVTNLASLLYFLQMGDNLTQQNIGHIIIWSFQLKYQYTYVYFTKKKFFGSKGQKYLKQRRWHTHEAEASSMVIIDPLNNIHKIQLHTNILTFVSQALF